MTSSRCSPSLTPPASVPKTEHECGGPGGAWDPLPRELRALTDDFADDLPDWSSTEDPDVDIDYDGLKAVAIRIASAPYCVQRAVIKTYSQEYCAVGRPDLPKASGLYLLLRVLFVLPTDYPIKDGRWFTTWSYPVRDESLRTSKWDLSWPVRAQPGANVIEIERSRGLLGGEDDTYRVYWAFDEFQYFWKLTRGRTRTPAEIEALEIKAADPHPSSR
jgi:hypothetical protein